MDLSPTGGSRTAPGFKDGDRRHVTVLFTDMVGFTTLAERMDPEEVDSLMSTVFSRFEAIVSRHGGTVEKYIGDAMVAAFGVPVIHEDDAVRAVNTALDFRDAIHAINRNLGVRDTDLRFRTGIFTGLITTGRRGDFEVITGNTMNMAARLQSMAEPGSILAAQTTLEECGTEFIQAPLQAIMVKGRSEPLLACEILGRNLHALVPEPHFRGHDDLVSAIMTQWMRHDGGKPAGVLLTGPAGIGKTALAVRCIDRIRQFPDMRGPVLHVRVRPFRPIQYAAITDLMVNHAGLSLEDPEDRIVQVLVERLGLETAVARDLHRFLHQSRSAEPPPGDPFSLLSQVFHAMLDQGRPRGLTAVILIDNANFMDKPSRDFLQWFLRRHQPHPFVILAERDPRVSWDAVIPGLAQHEVGPLSPEESRSLLLDLLGGRPHAEEEVRDALRASEGVPLFIHAYAKFLRDHRDDDPEARPEIPQTIQNLFLTTLASYNDDVRDFLTKLSVFIQNFTLDDALTLQTRTEGDPDLVIPALSFFEREDILYQDADGAWAFSHTIFKKALYHSLLNHNKKVLHQVVVDLMRTQAHPHTLRLLHHMLRAQLPAEAAALVLESPEAVRNLEFAPYLDLLLDSGSSLDQDILMSLRFRKAALLFNNGKADAADSMIKILLSEAFAHRRHDWAASAYHLLCAYNAQSYRFQKSHFCGLKALDYYRRAPGTEARQANVASILYMNAFMGDRPTQAERFLDDIHRMAAGSDRILAIEIQALLHRCLVRGRPDEARALVQAHAGSPSPEVQEVLAQRAWQVDMESGRFAEAFTGVEHWLAGARWRPDMAMATRNRAILARLLGDSRAPSYREEAEFRYLEPGNDFERLDFLMDLGVLWILDGDHRSIADHLPQGIVVGQRHSAYYPTFSLLVLYIESLCRQGQTTDAAFFLDEARHLVDLGVTLHPWHLVHYHRHRWRIAGESGALEQARTLMENLLSAPGLSRAPLLALHRLEDLES